MRVWFASYSFLNNSNLFQTGGHLGVLQAVKQLKKITNLKQFPHPSSNANDFKITFFLPLDIFFLPPLTTLLFFITLPFLHWFPTNPSFSCSFSSS